MSMTKGTPESSQIITLERMIEERDAEIDRLRGWINHYGESTDMCVYHALGTVCSGCECHRKVPNCRPKGRFFFGC